MNLRCLLLLASLPIGVPVAQAQTLVNSINGNLTPESNTEWGPADVGWVYTPASSYSFNEIQSKFGNGFNNDTFTPMSFSVYTNLPNNGGTLLASSTSFTPTGANVPSGSLLNATLNFVSGQSYFIVINGAGGNGVNVTNNGGAVAISPFYAGSNDDFTFGPLSNLDINNVILDFLQVSVGTTFAATPGLTPNQGSVAANVDFNSVTPSAALAAVIAGLNGVPAPGLPSALSELTPVQFGLFASSTAINNATFATEQRDEYLAGERAAQGGFLGGSGTIDTRGLTVNDPSYDPALQMVHSRLLAWNAAPATAISDSPEALLGGVDMKDMKCPACCCAEDKPWNVFVEGDVILAQGFSQADLGHFDDNTESVNVGADYRITRNFLVGLIAGYGHTDTTLDNSGSSATVDSYSPGFYASYADNGWYANLTGSYLHNAYTQSRVIGFLGQTANSAPEGNEGVADIDGGYDFHSGAWTFGPLAGVQYTHLTVDGYTESGSAADLTVASQNADSLRSRLGGRVSYDLHHCGLTFTPHLDASWQHEFMDQSRGISSQFNGGLGSFSVSTPNPSRESALVEAGLDVKVDDSITAFGDYMVQAGQDDYFGQSIQAGVKIGF